MSSQTLPPRPSLAHLKAQAKELFQALNQQEPDALARCQEHQIKPEQGEVYQLHHAQLTVAREYGFPSWRALKEHVDQLAQKSLEEQIIQAAEKGEAKELDRLLQAHPELINTIGGNWSVPLGHLAGEHGHLGCLQVLEKHGYDFRQRCQGDNAYALHFAAEQGHLDCVKWLLERIGDVEGEGDLHERGVLGWATCTSSPQEEVAAYLMEQGAKLDIFSAIALNRGEEVRRFVEADAAQLTRPMSRFEHHRTPLHHAVKMGRPEMVRLLLDLGANPNAKDDVGALPLTEFNAKSELVIQEMLLAAGSEMGFLEALMAGKFDVAEKLLAAEPEGALQEGGRYASAILHLATKSQTEGVRWLLEHGADPNIKAMYWDCNATALHFAVEQNRLELVQLLIESGADPYIEDDKHHGDAFGWADFFSRKEIRAYLGPRQEKK